MSCFKLPKDVCDKLTSAMIEFWWSSGNNKKKISWVAWKKLCTEKELGGLGFKDIERFNQSLFAKQAWRIWSSPNSLLARLLKHRYFNRSEFLDCGIGARPSYAWRSIMHGRELLKEGLFSKIGNGRNTKVWLDNWLLDSVSRPPRYRQDAIVYLTLTVNDLLDQQTGSWNVDMVCQLIAEEDINLVLKTRPVLSRADVIVWGFSKNGCYDSKSGYKLLDTIIRTRSEVQVSIPPIEKQLWSKLWKTKTSPKLRHFLWRVMSGALAVKAQLRTRGIMVDTTCPVCHQGPETICHMLFHCQTSKDVWKASRFPLPTAGWSRDSVFLNMYHLISHSHKQHVGASVRLSFPWILWQIWKAGNRLCFEQVQPVASDIVTKAKEEAVVWLNLHGCLPDSPIVSIPATVEVPVWSTPPAHALKCNIGATWSESSHVSGAGWIIRDSVGKVLSHSRRAFSGVASSTHADLLALSWASAAVIDLKLKNIMFEFSSVKAAGALNNPLEHPLSYHLCHEVINNVYSLTKSGLFLVPESCNVAASAIATSVTKDQRLQSYIAFGGPHWLSAVLLQEAI